MSRFALSFLVASVLMLKVVTAFYIVDGESDLQLDSKGLRNPDVRIAEFKDDRLRLEFDLAEADDDSQLSAEAEAEFPERFAIDLDVGGDEQTEQVEFTFVRLKDDNPVQPSVYTLDEDGELVKHVFSSDASQRAQLYAQESYDGTLLQSYATLILNENFNENRAVRSSSRPFRMVSGLNSYLWPRVFACVNRVLLLQDRNHLLPRPQSERLLCL